MPKVEQALILDPPAELHFKGPFTDVTTSYLNLTNPTERQVCFKVKTTAPKTYCVRPNSGVVLPKETVVVAVMLQPFDFESADKSKHKFMVQTMFAPDGDINQETLWRDASPESLMNSKLRCVFDMPGDQVQNNFDSSEIPKDETEIKPTIESIRISPPKLTNVDLEMRKTVEDNKRLKEELSELRQENSQLKEEGLRWRIARGGTAESQSTTNQTGSVSQQQQVSDLANLHTVSTNTQSSGYFLLIVALVFFVGLIIGKFVI